MHLNVQKLVLFSVFSSLVSLEIHLPENILLDTVHFPFRV